MQENNRGSIVETFRPMIEHPFEIFFTHGDYPTLMKEKSFYFIGIGRQRQRPTWAERALTKAGPRQNPVLAVSGMTVASVGNDD